MKFSANLSFLYPELGFLERFAAAARDGFPAVEYLGPYAEPKEKVAEALVANGLVQALFNVPSGDWAGGERGIAALPGRTEEFRAGIATALDYAAALDCKKLNVISGLVAPGADLAAMEATLVDNLKYAAPRCAEAGIKLLIEPINLRDIPGFFLSTTAHAERILERVGHDNLYIQYDLYHMQVMQGDLVPTYAAAQGPHRPHPARRQSRPQRARHRRDQLRLRAAGDRAARLRRIFRLRVQAQGRHQRGAGLDAALFEERIMKIGFIGLGVMGRPMAAHLIAAGHDAVPPPGEARLAGAGGQGRHGPRLAARSGRRPPRW